MTRFSGEYPPNWKEIANKVKESANWACVRCGHSHEPASGHTLTVHHLDNNKSNINWDNLVSLCQKCHLIIQSKVIMDRPWMLEHSEWFKPFAGSHFARKYLGLNLSREEVEANLDFYVALEKNTLQATEYQQSR